MDNTRLQWATVPIFVAALLVVGILAWRGMAPETVMLAVTTILAAGTPSLLFKPRSQQVPPLVVLPAPPIAPSDPDETTPSLGSKP